MVIHRVDLEPGDEARLGLDRDVKRNNRFQLNDVEAWVRTDWLPKTFLGPSLLMGLE